MVIEMTLADAVVPIVTLFDNAPAVDIETGPVPIVTSVVVVGSEAGFQFVVVNQSVSVAPVQFAARDDDAEAEAISKSKTGAKNALVRLTRFWLHKLCGPKCISLSEVWGNVRLLKRTTKQSASNEDVRVTQNP